MVGKTADAFDSRLTDFPRFSFTLGLGSALCTHTSDHARTLGAPRVFRDRGRALPAAPSCTCRSRCQSHAPIHISCRRHGCLQRRPCSQDLQLRLQMSQKHSFLTVGGFYEASPLLVLSEVASAAGFCGKPMVGVKLQHRSIHTEANENAKEEPGRTFSGCTLQGLKDLACAPSRTPATPTCCTPSSSQRILSPVHISQERTSSHREINPDEERLTHFVKYKWPGA